jgi:hypothetical protein
VLWGKNPAVPVGFLLEFFLQAPPPILAHLRFDLGFDVAQGAATLGMGIVHGPE